MLLSLALLVLSPQSLEAIAAKSDGLAQVATIGTSRGGRPIQVVTLAGKNGPPPAERLAVLVVAGANGRSKLGTQLAQHQLEKLIADQADPTTKELLDRHVFYFVPVLNPDGQALGRSGNARDVDLDRDGKAGEDGPQDLDGDGEVRWMRWKDPKGTLVPDEKDPRLLRPADPKKGERGEWSLAPEGKDDDGDGERDEDPPEGVQVARNFGHGFAEFDRAAGGLVMGEPEARALADFVFAHQHLAMAFVWGDDDTLMEMPKTGKIERQKPLAGILESDKPLYERAGELYREKTTRKKGTAATARFDGSPWSWLYFQVLVPTFATDIWSPLDGIDAKDPCAADRARLQLAETAEVPFAPWQPFKHPQLGDVQIGGLPQHVDERLLPAAKRDELFAAHHAFCLEVVGWLPRVSITEFTAKSLPGGAFELKAVITNSGQMDALTGLQDTGRRFLPPELRLEVGDTHLLAGKLRSRAGNLKALGGNQEFTWLIAGTSGQKVGLLLRGEPAGRDHKEVTL